MRNLIFILSLLVALTSDGQKYYLGFQPTKRIGIDFTNAHIVCDGNSLTYGYQSSNPATKSYPAVLATLSPWASNGATITNKGVSGQTTADMSADATMDIDPLYSSSVASVLVAWEIGNDLYFNGDTAAAYSRFVSYCTARRAVGWKVVVITVPYRDHSVVNGGVSPAGDNDATYNLKRDSINVRLRANWPTFADAIYDLAADANFSSYNTTYFNADHVHYTDVGYAYIAAGVSPIIQSL